MAEENNIDSNQKIRMRGEGIAQRGGAHAQHV